MTRWVLGVLAAWVWASSAAAAQLVQVTPVGQVATVEQVRLHFDADMVDLGNDQAPAPASVQCTGEPAASSRWADTRLWVYTFDKALGPGVRCEIRPHTGLRARDGQLVQARTQYTFSTGGPQVLSAMPYGGQIDENQIFVLRFNGAVASDSLRQHAHCVVQGLGEQVPVRLVDDTQIRRTLLEARYLHDAVDSEAVQLLQCARRLTPGADVRLVLGAGVATPSGLTAGKPWHVDYQVRPAFRVGLSCQRDHARADCNPLLPVRVTFNAPVPEALAEQVHLRTGAGDVLSADLPDSGWVGSVDELTFSGPFEPEDTLTLAVPDGLRDDADRVPANVEDFPLQLRTAQYPALLKFASGRFGVVERFAHVSPGEKEDENPPAVPLTVRNVEARLAGRNLSMSPGTVTEVRPADDKDILRWYARVRNLDEGRFTRAQWARAMAGQPMGNRDGQPEVDARSLSMLEDQPDAKILTLPGSDSTAREAEVLGVPLTEPGFHVLEAASPRLGRSLLDASSAMYVRTAVLVTNLAVHLKRGRDDALVWVTTLDRGQVVPGAQVAIRDCDGELLASGQTDAQGMLHVRRRLDSNRYCESTGLSDLFASARIDADHPLARGKAEMSFVLSGWDDGIEGWRFNLPTDSQPVPDVITHTVFDRGLYRAGETVHMKHFVRWQTRDGLSTPDDQERLAALLPTRMRITHQGSGESVEQSLQWARTPSGGMSAVSALETTRGAKLGAYEVSLVTDGETYYYDTNPGMFRIEAFKLPVLTGVLSISAEKGEQVLVAPRRVKADVRLGYVAGGAASGQAISLSAMARDRVIRFEDYEGFEFQPPSDPDDEPAQEGLSTGQRLFVDKRTFTLDAQGAATLDLDTLPEVTRPMDWLFEASFDDPNGQVQTLSQVVPVWPAAVVPGIRADGWSTVGEAATVSIAALSTQGKPQAGASLKVTARRVDVLTTRKRLVGGFYSYDSHTRVEPLGEVCQGKADAQGMLHCAFLPEESGRIELIVTARDEAGRLARAVTSIWVTGGEALWFGGGNDDRIDVVPARRTYAPGEQAEFMVKMPFRAATALVSVEREGILQSRVVQLEGESPLIRLPVQAEWGPNVYVSVLALRHRLYEVPWYSFFDWGWKRPGTWWRAWRNDSADYQPATGYVDLSKPTFRFGVAEIRVSDEQDRLQVQVQADKPRYGIREQANITLQVLQPDGRPAAHAQALLAVVDEALLELSPNASWDLLSAMRQRRAYGVQTATAQSQVVGRRHYGRKALPPGGGGGSSLPTRELLDTLVYWQPDVQLDAQGKATVSVPLNDSLSAFRIVAVADHGASQFGTGQARIVTAQDLQVISGLPAVVREGDVYEGGFTLRNGTDRVMTVTVQARATGPDATMALPERQVSVPAGGAMPVTWTIEVPVRQLAGEPESTLQWDITAQAGGPDSAADRLSFAQQLLPAVPVAVTHGTVRPLAVGELLQLPVRAPDNAQQGPEGALRGGVQVSARSSLGGGLPGVRAWFQAYPYTCVEQLGARAIGLRDTAQWQDLAGQLSDYLDEDGLLAYFPGMRQGSEVLTAHMLILTDEARRLGWDIALPDDVRARMVQGLSAFVHGRLNRDRWAPMHDRDARRLMVLEALSRAGAFRPGMLDTLQIAPERWMTSALIDWASLLHREAGIPGRDAHAEQAWQLLQGRLLLHGDGLVFPQDARHDAWWLLSSPQVNAARLMLLWAQMPKARDTLPALALGLLQRQHHGAWETTVDNVFASLAFEQFAQVFEGEPVKGSVALEWLRETEGPPEGQAAMVPPGGDPIVLPWPPQGAGILALRHQGQGQPWVSVQALAAVPQDKPVDAGLSLERKVTPITQARPGVWSRGDVYRVDLALTARAPTVWAVISDPVPAGATVLGSGLGRDSAILAQAGKTALQPQDGVDETGMWPSYEARRFDAYQAYFEYLPQGVTRVSYTVRLNTKGRFHLPAPRAEALYQAGVYGMLPQSSLQVHAQP